MLRPAIILLSLCFLLSGNVSNAQNGPFTIGAMPESFEISYQQCSFDKEADAVYFINDAVSEYNDDYNLITYHHIKIKILKDKGIKYADISIPYYRDGDFEKIEDIEGVVYNTVGENSTNVLDKKSIYRQNTNKYWGEVKFAFPGVKAGSIIEYTYRSVMKNYGGLKDWVFQKDIPVVRSKYLLNIVPNTEFAYAVQKLRSLKIDIKPDNANGKISFEMENIPGMRDENYIDSKNDYLQKVTFQLAKYSSINYMTSWQQVNNELTSNIDFYGQLNKNLAGTDEFIKKVKADTSAFERMKAVYGYVKSNMTWNNINSRYSTDGIKDAWAKKTGSSGDLNLILTNLLRAADLDAAPMLVSERYHGRVNPALTFIDQFNTTYACVTIQNRRYYLDATEKYTPCHLTPYLILNTTAFIVNKRTGTLINIFDTITGYKENITIDASINSEGKMNGKIARLSYDYARSQQLKNYKNKSSADFEKAITGNSPGLVLQNLEMSNNENENEALTVTSNFACLLSNSGDYSFIPVNLLSGLNENPFTGTNRFSNINFGYKQYYSVTLHLQIDSVFSLDALPKSVKLSNPEKDIIFSRTIFANKENNELLIKLTLEINNPLYEATQYSMIKDFYKQMYDMLTEQVVLKKK
jgi:transglutaminase-like putative cysteine protease